MVTLSALVLEASEQVAGDPTALTDERLEALEAHSRVQGLARPTA